MTPQYMHWAILTFMLFVGNSCNSISLKRVKKHIELYLRNVFNPNKPSVLLLDIGNGKQWIPRSDVVKLI